MAARTPKKPRFIKPANVFKQKVGSGGIEAGLVEQAQEFIETARLDYMPYAKAYLKEFGGALKKLDVKNHDIKEKKQIIIAPVMQLKASGGMFHYQLLSDVADIALQFLENVEDINEDAVEILQAHQNTLEAIVKNNLTGDGGREGYALVVELNKACKRYFSKHKKAE